MPRHDEDKRVFMVEKYHEFKSSLKVIEAWKQKFPDIKPPTPMCILFQVKKLIHMVRLRICFEQTQK